MDKIKSPLELLGKAIEPEEISTNEVKRKTIRTDVTNAERICELFGDNLRYDHKRQRWLVWDGNIWRPDVDGEVNRLAIESARMQYKEAENIEDYQERLAAAKWAISSEAKSKLDAAIGILKNLKPIADDGENWDSDPMLLACRNGIIDLTTGKLRPGRQEDRITMQVQLDYDPKAKYDRWKQFILEVFGGDKEIIRFVFKALGYSITGLVREQAAFFCYGQGRNGKSKLFTAVSEVLGDYSYIAPASLLQRSYQNNSTNDVASTENKRFLISAEALSTGKINEQRLKAWTGGDKETARYLYKEYFSFQPTVKIWLFLNHKPGVEDDGYGFWRRIRLIPFEQKFVGENDDKALGEKLRAEYQGILAWLVKGCLLWQKEGLEAPEAVIAATKDYQTENDILAEFIFDTCIEGEGRVKASVLYNKYKEWTDEQSLSSREDVLTSRKFGLRMTDKFKKEHDRDGWYYVGISINGDGYIDPSSLKRDGYTPNSINPLYEREYREFSKNDPYPSHSLKHPSHSLKDIENKFGEEEDYVED